MEERTKLLRGRKDAAPLHVSREKQPIYFMHTFVLLNEEVVF